MEGGPRASFISKPFVSHRGANTPRGHVRAFLEKKLFNARDSQGGMEVDGHTFGGWGYLPPLNLPGLRVLSMKLPQVITNTLRCLNGGSWPLLSPFLLFLGEFRASRRTLGHHTGLAIPRCKYGVNSELGYMLGHDGQPYSMRAYAAPSC